MIEVQVKTANKSIRVMRHDAARKDPGRAGQSPGGVPDLDDSEEVRLESVLSDILCSNLTHKLSKGDPEFKVFKENYDRVIPYFLGAIKKIPDEVVFDIFNELNNRVDEVATVLQKNMLDFCELSNFFCRCLRDMNPLTSVPLANLESSKNRNIFQLALETLATIGNKLLNHDPQQTEVYFLEYAVNSAD